MKTLPCNLYRINPENGSGESVIVRTDADYAGFLRAGWSETWEEANENKKQAPEKPARGPGRPPKKE